MWRSSHVCNAAWPRTSEALCTHFPEPSAWTDWQHQSDSVTSPTGAPSGTNRDAEQGDVLGTSRARWSWVRDTHLGDFLSSLPPGQGRLR